MTRNPVSLLDAKRDRSSAKLKALSKKGNRSRLKRDRSHLKPHRSGFNPL